MTILADDVEVEYVLRQDHVSLKAGTTVTARRSRGFVIFTKDGMAVTCLGSRCFLQDIEDPTREELDAQQAAIVRHTHDAAVFLAS